MKKMTQDFLVQSRQKKLQPVHCIYNCSLSEEGAEPRARNKPIEKSRCQRSVPIQATPTSSFKDAIVSVHYMYTLNFFSGNLISYYQAIASLEWMACQSLTTKKQNFYAMSCIHQIFLTCNSAFHFLMSKASHFLMSSKFQTFSLWSH